MNTEELMIGDWVKISHLNKIGKVYRIDRANGKGNGFAAVIDGDYYEGNLEPIPLTSEILEKNGFEYKGKELGLYGVTIAPHYVRDDVPFEVFCDGEPFAIWFKEPINIKYIHQLQHALRLCEIKKEIEL